MKRARTVLFSFLLLFLSTALVAQTQTMDQQSEKNVQITSGPTISNISGNAATITWNTNSTAANHVRYRIAGSNQAWKSSFQPGGSKDHTLQLSGLTPGQTYEWQILTRDGDVRTSGQFQTAATAGGTMPNVTGAATPTANPEMPAAGAAAGARVPLYRADNAKTGGHFYTTDQGQMTAAQGVGFSPVGTVGYVSSSQQAGTVPLYVAQNPGNNDHFYTTSQSELNQVLASGFQNQGIVGYVPSSQQAGTTALHRLSNTTTGQHFYTANPAEIAQATQQGFHDENSPIYVWTQPQ